MYKLLIIAFFALVAVALAAEEAQDQKADDLFFATYGYYPAGAYRSYGAYGAFPYAYNTFPYGYRAAAPYAYNYPYPQAASPFGYRFV